MKKAVAMMSALVLTTAMLAGCGGETNETGNQTSTQVSTQASTEAGTEANDVSSEAQETAPAADAGKAEGDTFIVGFDAEFAPYGYRDESGEYVGFDLELAAEVCARNGWELVKQPIDWDAKDMELSSGAIDCIWNGFTINGREDAYTWSTPYVDNSQVFIVAADSGITNKEELAGKIVAVQKDSSALAALNDEKAPENIALRDSFAELIEYGDYNTAFMDLEMGSVEAVAIDIGVAKYQIEQREEGAFLMLDGDANKLAVEQYGIGFLLGNEALRDQVQASLDEMAADGTFAQIAETWGLTDSVCFGQ